MTEVNGLSNVIHLEKSFFKSKRKRKNKREKEDGEGVDSFVIIDMPDLIKKGGNLLGQETEMSEDKNQSRKRALSKKNLLAAARKLKW